jgi:hypothetical protein
MPDRVVTINNTHWPAYRKPGATLVDLRMFDPDDRSPKPRLVFRPEKLRELGIPDALIEAAAKSDPHGKRLELKAIRNVLYRCSERNFCYRLATTFAYFLDFGVAANALFMRA